jgi:ribose 5-phosphate isomerase A
MAAGRDGGAGGTDGQLTFDIEEAKRTAANRAVDLVSSGSVIGLGTGSTMRYVLEALARKLDERSLRDISGVPTSGQTASLAGELRIPLTTLGRHPRLPLTIDGADEIDPGLNLIKGLGGALLREKIVAFASETMIVVADDRKIVPVLGSRAPVPIEVVPFALSVVFQRLESLPGRLEVRAGDGGAPFVTDEGNHIIDYYSGPIADAASLDIELQRIPGVIEHGLFLGMAARAIVAGPAGVQTLTRAI